MCVLYYNFTDFSLCFTALSTNMPNCIRDFESRAKRMLRSYGLVPAYEPQQLHVCVCVFVRVRVVVYECRIYTSEISLAWKPCTTSLNMHTYIHKYRFKYVYI